MDKPEGTRIRIDHAQHDGCHVITSPDVPGLLLVSQDLDRAMLQLPGLIETLMFANCGIRGRVELAEPPLAAPPEALELLPAA